jgi:hypothetical protein
MKPRKLTSEQVEYVREIGRERRRIMALLANIPTQARLATELQCSKRLIEDIQSGKQYAKRYSDADLDAIAALARA